MFVKEGDSVMIAGYVRVSTQKQADDGVSIEMQQQMIIRHAKMLELIDNDNGIKFYIDDGFSGSTLERPEMKRLINDIKNKRINILIAYDLSRISRDIFDSNKFLNMSEKYNVIIKCLYDDVSIATATSRFGTNIKILTNQYEREKIVERTNDSLKSIADSGRYPCGGRPTYGYYRGDDKNLYVDEEQAEVVRKVFDMAVRGYNMRDIVDYIRGATKKVKPYENTIMRMLQNVRYKGELEYKGKVYTNLVPAIVDEATFNKANYNFRRTKPDKDSGYLFDGLVVCSKCNSIMRCSHGINHQGKRYYYYICSQCKKQISQLKLEKQFIQLDKHTNSVKVYRDKLMSRRRSLKLKIDKVNERYQIDEIEDDEFYRLAVILDKQLDSLNRRIEGMGSVKFEEWWDIQSKIDYVKSRVDYILFEFSNKEIKNIKYIEYTECEEVD